MNPKWKVSINSQIRRDGYHIFFHFEACICYSISSPLEGNDLVKGQGLCQENPCQHLSLCSLCITEKCLEGERVPPEGTENSAPWGSNPTSGITIGVTAYWLSHKAAQGKDASIGLPRGGAAGRLEGRLIQAPTAPPHPVSTPLKRFTADKNILCLNVTREQRELCFIRTIRNGAITIFLYCPGWGEEIE